MDGFEKKTGRIELPMAPGSLSSEARALWEKIVTAYEMTEPHTLAILQTALEAFDRMKEAGEIIRRDGIQVMDRFDRYKKNPMIDVERDCRRQFYDGMRMLNLDIDPLRDGPGRPAKSGQLFFDL